MENKKNLKDLYEEFVSLVKQKLLDGDFKVEPGGLMAKYEKYGYYLVIDDLHFYFDENRRLCFSEGKILVGFNWVEDNLETLNNKVTEKFGCLSSFLKPLKN